MQTSYLPTWAHLSISTANKKRLRAPWCNPISTLNPSHNCLAVLMHFLHPCHVLLCHFLLQHHSSSLGCSEILTDLLVSTVPHITFVLETQYQCTSPFPSIWESCLALCLSPQCCSHTFTYYCSTSFRVYTTVKELDCTFSAPGFVFSTVCVLQQFKISRQKEKQQLWFSENGKPDDNKINSLMRFQRQCIDLESFKFGTP